MKRAWMGLWVGFALSTPAAFAGGGEESFTHRCELDYLRNNHWPKPFIYADRDAVRAPFSAMVAKGWQRQNTLGDCHFDPNTNELNRAGQLRIQAIALQTIPERRTVLVYRGASPDALATRIDSVHRYTVTAIPEGELPPVVATSIPPVERPGEQIDKIQTGVLTSMPNPVLPPFQAITTPSQ